MTFTVTDQAALGKIFAAAKAGDWQSAYQEVLNAITVQEKLVSAEGWTSYVDRPATADIEGVWVWVNGAKKVNAGTGSFAEYIRKYTASQYELRKGESATDIDVRIQAASNEIAENFIYTFLYGGEPVRNANGNINWNTLNVPASATVPDLHKVGEIDASGAASQVFKDVALTCPPLFGPGII